MSRIPPGAGPLTLRWRARAASAPAESGQLQLAPGEVLRGPPSWRGQLVEVAGEVGWAPIEVGVSPEATPEDLGYDPAAAGVAAGLAAFAGAAHLTLARYGVRWLVHARLEGDGLAWEGQRLVVIVPAGGGQ